jgi:hypothetical protein
MLSIAPYGYLGDWAGKRSLLPFEGVTRKGMSGGAIFHDKVGLIGIHVGSNFYREKSTCLMYFYLKISNFLNIFLNYFCCLFNNFPVLNDSIRHESLCAKSVSLATCKDWIEEHRVKYGDEDMI